MHILDANETPSILTLENVAEYLRVHPLNDLSVAQEAAIAGFQGRTRLAFQSKVDRQLAC